MSYSLETGESVSNGIRRLMLEWIDQARHSLTSPDIDRDIGVHEARKICKRIRSALRLVRDEIGEDLYRQENIRFRDTARLLAAARDSWVMITALDKLTHQHKRQLPRRAFEGVRAKLVAQYEANLASERANAGLVPQVLENLESAAEQSRLLPLHGKGFAMIQGGLRRVYEQGQRAMRQAYIRPNPANFHEWRKRVKYLWYQVEILANLWPNVMTNLAEEFHRLSEYLGDDHDLAVLRTTILEHFEGFADERELMILVGLIDQQRLRLEALARPLGKRLYFDSPRDFTRRMKTYWQAWRKESERSQANLIEALYRAGPRPLVSDHELLTTREIAMSLGLPLVQVRRLIYAGKLPAWKVGAIWVIKAWKGPLQQIDDGDEAAGADSMLSIREVAERLNLTPAKLRALIRAGEFPAARVGRNWVIREEVLEGFSTR
jgi:excisionase family DNA binding protein